MPRLFGAARPVALGRKRCGWALLVWLCAALAGCGQIAGSVAPTAPAQDTDTITQVSTYPALQRGQFGGEMAYAQLAQHGDFGLGTFDSLDGEMIALDGVFYQATADGAVRVADPALTTPFADVSFFHSTQQLTLNEPLQNLDQLKAYLTKQLPSANRPYAFKISGTFPSLKLRSVPRQPEPYPTLAAAVAGQVVFEERAISATLVGYVLPDYLGSVGVAGYHFHAISADKRRGGHVLDVSLAQATVDIDYLANVTLVIPQNATFQQTNFATPQP